jgi:aldehyde:ferredoxin oxidoreductase
VDLADGSIWVDEHDNAFYRKYVGGRGLVLYYLLLKMPRGIDPLGPKNLLVFAPGMLTGTPLPGSGRHGVGAKSPLTGALASGEAGGWWGSELKRAGFDGIVIEGRSEVPVYLWIKDGAVEIRDARHLWGRLTGDVEETICEELGDDKIRVAQIGPAGENLVRFACVINDVNRAAGRSGLGAVMGSKQLKAIAVRGSTRLGLADRDSMLKTTKWIGSNYETLMEWAVQAGTAGAVESLHDIGATPVKNFSEPTFEGIENLDAKNLFDLMLKGRNTCYACPVRCKIVVEYDAEEAHTIDSVYGGPEYESIGALGPLCCVDDPVAVAKANELCEAYGLDTISTGATVAFAMDCVEQKLLAPSPGNSCLPRFGDGEALIESIHRIANREGIGDDMAEGSARMAEAIGPAAKAIVVTTKRQEMPLHDPRLKNAMGMGYALSATGADHMHNMDDTVVNNPASAACARLEALGVNTPLPLFGLPVEKIQAFIYETAFLNFLDCAVICHFYPYEYHHIVDALIGATGWEMSKEEIVEIGMRVVTMGRLFVLREGFTQKDDKLPSRVLQPHDSGPVEEKALTLEQLESALQVYYRLMGWDEAGVPSPAALADLGLEWVSSPRE